jgi:tyrosine-protein phosphatase SIW14
MRRTLRNLFGCAMVILFVGGPLAYALHDHGQMRNFHVVREGVLYRSGQMSVAGLQQAIHDYDIKTVVSLRDVVVPGEPPGDVEEEAYCEKHEINFHRLAPAGWYAKDGPAPVEAAIRTFNKIMANPANYPVLVHCFAGVHRTGAYVAVYRMEREHWSNTRAISEVKDFGYTTLDDEWDVLGYLEVYQPSWQAPRPWLVENRLPPGKPDAKVRHSHRHQK